MVNKPVIHNDAAADRNAFEQNPSKSNPNKTGSHSWEQGQGGQQGDKNKQGNPNQGGRTGGQTNR